MDRYIAFPMKTAVCRSNRKVLVTEKNCIKVTRELRMREIENFST